MISNSNKSAERDDIQTVTKVLREMISNSNKSAERDDIQQ
jgi:hypothetical protein